LSPITLRVSPMKKQPTVEARSNQALRNTPENSRYTFSGKERDTETGYSYFGARYYNSDLSIWLSVDPLSDKYPNLTPYAYCANNPIILVDPDGKDVEDGEDWVRGKDGRYRYDSRVHSQEDAEKYYGKGAQAISNGYSYKTKQGEVMLLDKGFYKLNGVKKQVKDQATGLSKMIAIVKSTVKQLDQDGSGDPANDGDPELNEKVGPVLQGAALLNPVIGVPNSVYTAVAGEDIYGNEASTAGRIISGVSVVAGGVGTIASGVIGQVAKGIDKAINAWTVYQTTKDGYKKTKKQ